MSMHDHHGRFDCCCQWRQGQRRQQHAGDQRKVGEPGAEQQVEGQGHRKERQPDRHALLPARSLAVGATEPGIEADCALFLRLGEKSRTTLQPRLARSGMLPGGHGLFVAEAENDLKLIVIGGRCQHAGAEIARKVGCQVFAFTQPGDEVVITTIGDAARHHQGYGGHCVSPRVLPSAGVWRWAWSSMG